VSDDASFEKKLLASSLCPSAIDFLGIDGDDDFIGKP
jgi:hypothetical protein